jgi:hypothetical protein
MPFLPNHDVAWVLWLAQEVSAGRALYIDLIEINPPLIVWLCLPIVALARVLHVEPVFVYYTVLVLLLAGCAALTLRLLPVWQWPAAVILVLVLGPLAGADLGQREHLAVGCLLPILALAARRQTGLGVERRLALLAGVLAGVAISLKPHLAPAWLFLVLYRRPRLEDAGILTVGIVYLVAVGLVTPAYFPLARLLGPAYLAYDLHPITQLVLRPPSVAFVAAALTWLLVRQRARASVIDPILLAALGAWLAVLLQRKGWSYHWYPIVAFTVLASVAMLVVIRHAGRVRSQVLTMGAAVFVLVAIVSRLRDSARDLAQRTSATEAVQAATRPGDRVLVLSGQVTDAWPGVSAARVRWAGRVPSLWFTDVYGPNHPSRMGQAERRMYEIVVRDLATGPDVVLVESAEANGRRNARAPFDLLAYVEQASGSSVKYRRIGVSGGLEMWRRDSAGIPGVCSGRPFQP